MVEKIFKRDWILDPSMSLVDLRVGSLKIE